MVQNQDLIASVIVCNFNYERFISDALASVFSQSYRNIEIIVVDDGSTDRSRDIISTISKQREIKKIFKNNAGQASAFNAGVKACIGDIIFFLDSDDLFYPQKVEKIIDKFSLRQRLDERLLLCHRLAAVDDSGNHLGFLIKVPKAAPKPIPEVSSYIKKYKFVGYGGSPTSGLALTRSLAEALFPIPEDGIKTSADDFVVIPSALIGKIEFTEDRLGDYRIHGMNAWYSNHQKPKSLQFIFSLESFVNQKLQDNGIDAKASFFDSWHARNYYIYHREVLNLFKLAFRVPSNHLELKTIRFCLKTLLICLILPFLKQKDNG
jgi:glycosyltransferase involved in cell wall biosynthesis